MSIRYNDKSGGTPQEVLLAGTPATDLILNGTSKNPIANKTVYNALATKIESTVENLVNFYNKSQVYNKQEVRDLIGAINTLTIEVVNELPTQDISATTIYFLKQSGANTYDEYIYVDNAWVKIGDTDIDLSGYLTTANFQIAIADYYTKSAIDAMIANYYTKTQVDAMVDAKQDTLTFDNAPTAGSDNPVKSGGIKTALDAKQNTLTFDSTPTEDSSNPVTSDGIKDAIEARKFSNPNLLDNPWFIVNQRGQSDYPSTTWTYWVDRWQTLSKSSSTIGRTILLDNGIKISADTISTTCDIVYERKMKDDFVFGKTYTLSFMLGDGTIYSKSGVITEPDGTYKINITLTEQGLNARIANETNQQVSCIITAVKDNTAMTLRAVKLELGEVSTLANDVIPDYATELAKCRTSTAVATDTFANQGSYFLSADNAILGAKNLLHYPYVQTTQTKYGVTFTDNGDGTLTISGTQDGSSTRPYYGCGQWWQTDKTASNYFLKSGSSIIASISTSNDNIGIRVFAFNTSGSTVHDNAVYGSQELTVGPFSTDVYVAVCIETKANSSTIDNVTIYPMLRLASDTDSTYQPYAMTNRELTEVEDIFPDLTLSSSVTNNDTWTYASRLGKVVTINISFKVNTAIAQYGTIASGLPAPKLLTPLVASKFDSTSSSTILYIDKSGNLKTQYALAANNSTIYCATLTYIV